MPSYTMQGQFKWSAHPNEIFSTRCNIYISRLCYDVSVHLSVRDGSALPHYS